MTAPSLLTTAARARRLQLSTARKVDGMLMGEHLGVLAGPGGELAEVRPYVPGDDVRRFDWSALARTGTPHVRTTTAQRELDTTFVVDLSASMAFGTRNQDKRTLALTLVAAFGHLASGPGDRLSAVLLTGDGLRQTPPRPSVTAAPQLLSSLERTVVVAGPAPSLAQALYAVRARRRGLVVVVSDLLGGTTTVADPDWQRPLRLLATRHDVIVVEVVDPRELELPSVGLLRVVDPETDRHLDVPTGSKLLRDRYAAAARARRQAHADAIHAAGASHLFVRTDGDWLRDLSRFLTLRRRLRGTRRAGGL